MKRESYSFGPLLLKEMSTNLFQEMRQNVEYLFFASELQVSRRSTMLSHSGTFPPISFLKRPLVPLRLIGKAYTALIMWVEGKNTENNGKNYPYYVNEGEILKDKGKNYL